MSFSPTETASSARESCVRPPDLAPQIPFSPVERPFDVVRGVLEDELASSKVVSAAH